MAALWPAIFSGGTRVQGKLTCGQRQFGCPTGQQPSLGFLRGLCNAASRVAPTISSVHVVSPSQKRTRGWRGCQGPALHFSLQAQLCLAGTLPKACSQVGPVAHRLGLVLSGCLPSGFPESSSNLLEEWVVSLSPTLRMGPCAEDTWAGGVWFLHPPACLMGRTCLTSLWLQSLAMLKLQDICHLMVRADSLEKSLMLGKIEGRRRRG